jgi:hypothetical protein
MTEDAAVYPPAAVSGHSFVRPDAIPATFRESQFVPQELAG